MLIATTKGLGPFHPAIKLNNVLYVHPDEFESEDEAFGIAQGLTSVVDEKAFEIITSADYKAETR